jgi:hypothetical protein
MWKWDSTLGNKWARVAKCSQLLNIPIKMAGDAKEERKGTSWAKATRELRRLSHRIEAVGGSKDQWEAGVWHMDKEQWDLLCTGEQASGRRCRISLQVEVDEVQEAQGQEKGYAYLLYQQ